MQEYVPAGNGDASGEYANEEGNNRHFTSFKKPEEGEDGKTTGNNGGDKKPKIFIEYLNKNHNNEFGKLVERDYNAGNDQAKNLINIAVNKYGVELNQTNGTSYYRESGKSVNLNVPKQYSHFLSKEEGETFYHEFWHANDNVICSDGFITEEEKQRAIDYAGKMTRSYTERIFAQYEILRNASTCKTLSNGKTLYQTIREEFKLMKKTGKFEEMKAEYKQEISKLVKQAVPEYEAARAWLDEFDRKVNEEAYKLYTYEEYGSSAWGLRNQYRTDKIKNDKQYNKYQEIKQKGLHEELEVSNKVATYFMSLSDMYGAAYKDGYGFCGGHKTTYYKQRFCEAYEFMAEYGSAKARNSENSKKELELFKKYMPQSSMACEELQNLISKHMEAKK